MTKYTGPIIPFTEESLRRRGYWPAPKPFKPSGRIFYSLPKPKPPIDLSEWEPRKVQMKKAGE